MMKKYFFILIISFFVFVPSVFAETQNGFILDQIWYSNNSLKEGDTVKIYTAVWNGEENPISVKVEFYDKNVILGTRDVVVPSQNLQEVSVSWKVTGGDHTISAKIIGATLNMSSGKKEIVVLSDNTTSTDNKFIPIIVKEENGITSTSKEVIKDQLGKVEEKINEILPESVSNTVREGTVSVEEFRDETLEKIILSEKETEEKIIQLKNQEISGEKDGLESATEKPIAQVKLFFLKVLHFIFNNKLIFYVLIILAIFYIIRGIYRKIRNR
jgi:hypothetical protein